MAFLKRHDATESIEADDEANTNIDPELRLRTVRTAHSTITESARVEARAQRRKTRRAKFFRRRNEEKKRAAAAAASSSSELTTSANQIPGERRNVYVNSPLSTSELDPNGEPIMRYVRNKVRTSKYTILTFIPKNLYEQFRRVANLYFLAVVIVQLFPVFGAANGQIAMIPLVFILAVTMIKDGIEDYRRATLDEEVNNTASTKLTQWRNVNQPTDPRSWIEKLLGINPPGKVTKGVRKLREKEASEGHQIVLAKQGEDRTSMVSSLGGPDDSTASLGQFASSGRRLEDIQSVDSHTYPPGASLSISSTFALDDSDPNRKLSTSGSEAADWSTPTLHNTVPSSRTGVVDLSRRISGVARWERTLWKKLEVGDIVLLRDNEQVPADIVVLSTSDPDGICYLETKNLDGETNLKPRKSVRGTSHITSEGDVERSSFFLDSEPPHQNLYLYNGVLRYKDPVNGEMKQESVTINELLLRGCTVRNTDWIIGLVVFTGPDTKIMLNGGDTPSKQSKIEKETNFNVIVNFVILIIMCAITAIASGIDDGKTDTSRDVYEIGSEASDSHVVNGIVTFVSCLIAFQNIVPISLYISIEVVKTIQAFFISQDIDMYYEPFDTACVPKTWNISDDLGQIEYVFSDKTGTLTQNIMEFQKCSIHGVIYGEGVTEAQRGAAAREGRTDLMDPEQQKEHLSKLKEMMIEKMARTFKNRYARPDKLTLIDPKLADDMADRAQAQRGHIIAFFRALSVCHSVLADRPEPNRRPFLTDYKAESPDEAALVAAARDAGFPFVNRSKDHVDIEVMGQPERYDLLKLLEFNSTRKRMSVVVRNPEGRIVLYTKGADSVIYQRLAPNHDVALKEQTSKDMELFANGGLRTLCIAYRYLTEEEYFNWSRVYDNATAAVNDRDEEIDKANEQIEHSLQILGATALEDKLQEGVPETIEQLHQAGIKLWILTGDKLQTAIEIGFSCNLLKSDMEIMIISADNPDSARLQIEAGLNKIASVLGPPSFSSKTRGFLPNAKASFATVIDGDTLRYALDPQLKQLFLNLGTQCETVVCCRVSPAQKALAVKMVKEGRNAMTLSIGDGANDVAMIQEANIGCGLFGLEGSQAAMSADYAFGQFRFLTKLLLVHGRWSYQRVADMHSNFFYKNVIWTFAMFWYLPWNSFDGTYLYQYTFILLCNVVFTSLPVIILGAFDQDINAKAALAFPQLYVRGIRGLEYTRTKFWVYMADGLYQSAVVYFIPHLVWTLGLSVSWNGRGIDSLADFGTTVSVAAIFTANTYVGINTRYWTVITWIIIVGSSLLMVIWIVIYSYFDSPDFIDEATVLFGGVTFWATVVISMVIALLPRYLVKFISTSYMPLDRDIVREMWVRGDLKDRLGLQHRRSRKDGPNLEAAPMLLSPHLRSRSELDQPVYQPVHMTSPASSPHHTGVTTQSSPSVTPNESLSSIEDEHAQYLVVGNKSANPSPLSHSSLPGAPSPDPSYYSATMFPTPSPLPTSQYGAPTHPLDSGPSQLLVSSQPPSPTPHTLAVPGRTQHVAESSDANSGSYEMSIRSPPPDQNDLSRASEFSWATAREANGSEGQRTPTLAPPGQPHDRPDSSLSWTGGRAL